MGKVQAKMAKDIHALITAIRRLREQNAELKSRLAYHGENY
jgi:cell division septum initiation protein DivIVA